MAEQAKTTVRMFGVLHTLRMERGLASAIEVDIPSQGCAACDLARELELPLERIDAVFVNHLAYDLEHVIQPGDRVAFVPTGIPGPHHGLSGRYGAGRLTRQCGMGQ